MSSRFDDRRVTPIVPMARFLLRQSVELQPGLGRHPLVAQPQSERKEQSKMKPCWIDPGSKKPSQGLAIIAFAACLLAAASAAAQAPKKVRIAYGGQTLNVSYPWLELPGPLNYWKQEGYDVEVFIAQSSLQAIQLLVAGQAEIAQINSAPLVQAAVKNDIPLRDVMVNTVMDWALVVPEDSAIHSLQDLKGKSIGAASLGTGGVAMLQSFMRGNGIDPERDVQLLPVGVGPLAMQALKSDKVQGLIYWGSAIAAFENFGGKFRKFFDPTWRQLPDFSMVVLQSTIERDPKMIEAVVRGAAKASLFALSNPDCARQVQWRHYPSTKPTGAEEATLIKWDLNYLNSSLAGMTPALEMSGGKLWGKTTPEQFARLQDYLVQTKLIDKKLANPADYVIGVPNFFESANNFDHEAIKAQAKQCAPS
jgi:NitT/TauT family transport system substrate-binding protein